VAGDPNPHVALTRSNNSRRREEAMKNPALGASPATLSIVIGADGQPAPKISRESQPASEGGAFIDGESFIDGAGLRRMFGGVSHMWAKRQMARDPTFPRPRYVGITPYWSLRALLAWWASLPTEPPPSSIAAGVQGVEVLKEARDRKKAEASPPAKPSARKSRTSRPKVVAE
jgi:hypothetical protein